jgi:hypothetical protein
MNQLLTLIPRHHFEKAVSDHAGNRYVKKFTTWNQLTTLLYAQASGKNTLRDIQTALETQSHKIYHLGLPSVKRSTLAEANSERDYQIMEKLFYYLLGRCQKLAPQHKFRFKNPVYTFDATFIDLCLALFPWAKFRRAKGAIKLHCQLDHRGHIPSFAVVTHGHGVDKYIAKKHFDVIPDSIYVMDRGYVDFDWLRSVDQKRAFFVSRAMDHQAFQITGQQEIPLKKGLLYDQTIELTGPVSQKKYTKPLRLVGFHDAETDRTLRFITNNFTLAASTIAQLYKERWQIELFFKWVKQHLKIKTFLGTSKNAVMTQVWVAMCYYLLLNYIKFQTRFKYSLFLLHRLIQNTLLDRFTLVDLLNLNEKKLPKIRDDGPQLCLQL